MTSGRFVTGLLLILFFLSGCREEPGEPDDCAGITPTYSADIKPIIDSNCALPDCHHAGSPSIKLSNYEQVKSESLDARFLGAIRQLPGYTPMPKGNLPLPDADVRKIACWINNGRPE